MSASLTTPDCLRLLPAEVMGGMPRLEFLSRLRKSGGLTGRHASPEMGVSIEFAEHREYAPGDDLRNLDWRVMAKSDRNVIKQFIEETSLRCTLAVDVSGSMGYGGHEASRLNGEPLTKLGYARYLTASLAYLFIKQGDSAGLVTFDREIRRHLLAGDRPSQVRRICEELLRAEPGDDTALGAVLHEVAERIPRRSLVILVSDLFDEPETIVEALHHFDFRRHELVIFHVLAEEELRFPFRAAKKFRDLEGVESLLRIDPQAVRAAYLERLREFVARVELVCGRLRADYVPVSTRTPVSESLLRYLGRRAERRR